MKNLIVVVLSYLLGCVNTGYYFTRIFYKQDIRTIGTNVTGATNVSRIAGNMGFIITFAGDFLKGVVAMVLCQTLKIGDTATLVCIFAVIAGHVFPFQLQFKGGKGLSTALGAVLLHAPMIVIYILAISGVVLVFVKKRTISVLIALFILPLVLLAADYACETIFLFIALDAIFLYAFRDNIRNYREKWRH